MSSTPVTPTPGLIKTIENDLSHLKTHVVLTLSVLGLVAALVLGAVWGVESIIGKIRQADDSRAAQYLAAAQATHNADTARLTADEAASAQREVVYLETIKSLATQMATRDAAAQQARTQASTLNAVDTAAAIAKQTNAAPGEVTAAGDSVTMDLAVARTVNRNMISLAQAQADLKDTQGQLTAVNGQLSDCRVTVADQKTVIAGDATVLAATQKKADADLAVEKTKTKKAGIKGFFIGAGTILSGILMHAVGI